jgi:hypothetical protein
MSPHAFIEDQLIEQPAIGLFGALGWPTVSSLEEVFGRTSIPGSLGSKTNGEVVRAARLRAALERLHPGASIEDESRWDEYLAWLTQRLVKMDQVLRPVVKGLP